MRFKAINKARKDGDTLDFCCEETPRCPHCGEPFVIEDNEAWWLYDQKLDTASIDCPSCELEFTTMVITKFYYSTDEAYNDLI